MPLWSTGPVILVLKIKKWFCLFLSQILLSAHKIWEPYLPHSTHCLWLWEFINFRIPSQTETNSCPGGASWHRAVAMIIVADDTCRRSYGQSSYSKDSKSWPVLFPYWVQGTEVFLLSAPLPALQSHSSSCSPSSILVYYLSFRK